MIPHRTLTSIHRSVLFGVMIALMLAVSLTSASAREQQAPPGARAEPDSPAVTTALASLQISFGDTILGALDAADPQLSARQRYDAYTFDGVTGQRVLIGLSAVGFDAFLWLLDPTGLVIAIDDDSGDRLDAILSDVALPQTGVYTLWASSRDAGQTGTYTLTLNELPAVAPGSALAVDDVVQGALSSSDAQLATGQYLRAYTLTASHGQAVSVTLHSDGFDTTL